MTSWAPPLALAGGSFVFLAFLLLFGAAIVFAYYSRSGSDITVSPLGDRGDRNPDAFADRSQDVRDWSRGTGGPNRRNLPNPRSDGDAESALDPETRQALRAWRDRLGSGMPAGLAEPVDDRRDHAIGPKDATVTVVNYSDFQCPACRSADQGLRRLVAESDADVRYVYRHFPLADAHDMALDAAVATEWAASHGRFWELHDAIYASKRPPSQDSLRQATNKLGLEGSKLNAHLHDHAFRRRVAEDFASGVRSGANGTPSIFINGIRHDDDLDEDTLRTAVTAAADTA